MEAENTRYIIQLCNFVTYCTVHSVLPHSLLSSLTQCFHIPSCPVSHSASTFSPVQTHTVCIHPHCIVQQPRNAHYKVTNGTTNDSTLLLSRPTHTTTIDSNIGSSSRHSVMPLVLLPRHTFACLQHCYFGLKEVRRYTVQCPLPLYRPVPFTSIPSSVLQRYTVQFPSALYRPVSFSAIPSSVLQRYTDQCPSAQCHTSLGGSYEGDYKYYYVIAMTPCSMVVSNGFQVARYRRTAHTHTHITSLHHVTSTQTAHTHYQSTPCHLIVSFNY